MKSLRKIQGDRTGLEQLVKWVGLVGLVVMLGLIYVWQQVQTRDLKRDILQFEQRRVLLIKENSILSVKVSRLSDQVAVKAKAMDMFALSYPAVGQVVAMTTAPQNDAVAYVPVGDGPETGESATAALSLVSISISHLNKSD